MSVKYVNKELIRRRKQIEREEIETESKIITELFLDIANKQNKTLEEVVETYLNVIKHFPPITQEPRSCKDYCKRIKRRS